MKREARVDFRAQRRDLLAWERAAKAQGMTLGEFVRLALTVAERRGLTPPERTADRVSVRVTEARRARVEELAREAGVTVSRYVRAALDEEAARQLSWEVP